MSFKEQTKILLTDNLQLKTRVLAVVNDLETEITRCVNAPDIVNYASIPIPEDFSEVEMNELIMLLKCNIGVPVEISEGKLYCKLINFL
jgi:hypothetical protein